MLNIILKAEFLLLLSSWVKVLYFLAIIKKNEIFSKKKHKL
jgi:hypothetical protein